MDRRGWTLLAVVVVAVALAVAAVGFAFAARDLRAFGQDVAAWTHPPTTVRPLAPTLLRKTRDLARLETASVELEQRVMGQRGTDGTWGWIGERLVFVARGEVTAGVDLDALAADALVVAPDGTVTVRLPPTTIHHVDLDEQASFVAARERGWFGIPDADLESEARRKAVQVLERAALDDGILGRAQSRAEDVVRSLLLTAGAPAVQFVPATRPVSRPSPPTEEVP